MKKDTTFAILGGHGMLGYDILQELKSSGFENVAALDIDDVNILDNESLENTVQAYDVIINCAAYTAVDKAESEEELCHAVNAKAPAELAKLCKAYNKKLLHFSTDFVFDGSGETPWKESDSPSPLSVYGKTKLEGEQSVLKAYPEAIAIRIQWTYGRNGQNFITKIAELAKSRDELTVVADQIGAPTPTTAVAKAALELLENESSGLFHFSAKGYCSRFEVAQLIKEVLNLTVEIKPCDSDFFKTPATRPMNTRFECGKIDVELKTARPEWKEALTNFLKAM